MENAFEIRLLLAGFIRKPNANVRVLFQFAMAEPTGFYI